MSPSDFLRVVLPSAGTYCAFELQTKRHHFTDSIEELAEIAVRLDNQRHDVYMALATFEEGSATRTADAALYLRALFLDLDCGEGKDYPDRKTALKSLQEFLQVSQLPAPWLVSSGNGIHAYWPFTENIPSGIWKNTAERLKKLCNKFDFVADPSVTADISRILRIPGTHNFKNPDTPKEVELRVIPEIQTHDFDTLAALIKCLVPDEIVARDTINLPGHRPASAGTISVKLIENSVTFFKPMLDATVAGAGCAQLEHYATHAGGSVEPLWRALASWANVCEDKDKAHTWLLKQHPRPADEVRSKINGLKGPISCAAMDGINPGVCATCPNYGKFTNPLRLGRKIERDETPKTVVLDTPIENEPEESFGLARATQHAALALSRPAAPSGFFYGKNGGVYGYAKDPDAPEDKPAWKEVEILPYDLFLTGALVHTSDPGAIGVVSMRNGKTTSFTMSSKSIVSKDETLKALAEQHVLSSYGQQLWSYLQKSYMTIGTTQSDQIVPDTYGWQDRNTFVMGSRVYDASGTVAPVPSGGPLTNLHAITTPAGNLENWRRVVALIEKSARYDILLASCVAWGAPLMRFTGFSGLCINVQSHHTGTGKSTALALAASVYGHPTDYWVTADTSGVTLLNRMGLLHSLPVITDEVTYKVRDTKYGDSDWIGGMLMSFTQGKGKERLDGATIKERRNVARWATLALFSSNASIVDSLLAKNTTMNGEVARIMEMDLSQKLQFTNEELRTYQLMNTNYGYAGQKYIEWIVKNQELTQSIVNEIRDMLTTKFKLGGDERYWHNGLTAMIAGAVLAGPHYADVVKLNIADLLREAGKLLTKMRGVVTSNVRTAEDVLHLLLRENYGSLLVLRKNGDKLATKMGLNDIADESLARGKVMGRVEIGFEPGVVSIFIERSLISQHCHATGYNSAAFKTDLGRKYNVIPETTKSMFANTRISSPRVKAMRIDLPMEEFEDIIEDEH